MSSELDDWAAWGQEHRPGVYLSSWANMERWQSPKSRPQIFTFLSAEPVAMSALSWVQQTQKS